MIREERPIRRPWLLALAGLLAGLLASLFEASCATGIKIGASADPLDILEPGAQAYARLSGAAARALAPSFFDAAELASVKPVLARTRILALGLGALPSPSEAPAPAMQIAIVGDFPFAASSLALASSAGWKRDKADYYNSSVGLRAAVPGSSLVIASTGTLDALKAAAKSPRPSPLPAKLSGLAASEVLLWVPEPFSGAIATILGEVMDVPLRGILIAATPVPVQEADAAPDAYGVDLVFVMADAESARVYKPVVKLAWYAIARAFWGDAADLSRAFSAEGELFRVSGIRITAAQLGKALGMLRAART